MKYDELISKLYERVPLCPDTEAKLMAEAANAIADLIFALKASNDVIVNNKPKWIPTTERLPETDKTVLVWDRRNSREYFDVCDHGRWIVLRQEDITHWMPLPEPPKDDSKDIPIEYFESGGK